MRPLVLVGSLAIVAISVLAILGGDDTDGEPELAPPPETAEPLPKLPPGWGTVENDAIGVGVGVPPSWSSNASAANTTLRSPGSAVVISVSADRTADAVETGLEDYALEIATGLDGDEAADARAPRPALGYEAAAATSGDTDVIVIRRPELAAYPMLVARNAKVKAGQLMPIVEVIVASLRGRPVTAT